MSTRKQILTQGGRQREPKSPQIYRRGRVNNSVAYYRGAKPDATAGGVNATAAKFLSDIAKPLGQISGKKQQEFQEAQRNEGIASFTRATPEQRAKMRYAIKNGLISESESPYFREGVSIAYTKSLLGKYNQELFQRYEQWEGKNKEDSGNFDQFLDEFDAEYAPHFETIHQDILTEHFIPGQMGVRRQLQQRHTEHLNKNYRDKAFGLKQGELYQILQSYPEDLVKEMLDNPDAGISSLIERGRSGNELDLDRMTVVTQLLHSDKITKEQRQQLMQFPEGQRLLANLDGLMKSKGAKPVGPAELNTEVKKAKKKKPTGRPDSVKIKEGDTVSKLAKKYGLTEEELLSYNSQIKDKNVIGLGDTINLVAPPPEQEIDDEIYPPNSTIRVFKEKGLVDIAKSKGFSVEAKVDKKRTGINKLTGQRLDPQYAEFSSEDGETTFKVYKEYGESNDEWISRINSMVFN